MCVVCNVCVVCSGGVRGRGTELVFGACWCVVVLCVAAGSFVAVFCNAGAVVGL